MRKNISDAQSGLDDAVMDLRTALFETGRETQTKEIVARLEELRVEHEGQRLRAINEGSYTVGAIRAAKAEALEQAAAIIRDEFDGYEDELMEISPAEYKASEGRNLKLAEDTLREPAGARWLVDCEDDMWERNASGTWDLQSGVMRGDTMYMGWPWEQVVRELSPLRIVWGQEEGDGLDV